MALYNEAGQRLSPEGRQPYDTVYRHNLLPGPTDPGWGSHRHKASGNLIRAINVHGPFDLLDEMGQEHHCSDGWLALDAEGAPFLLPQIVYDGQYEAVTE